VPTSTSWHGTARRRAGTFCCTAPAPESPLWDVRRGAAHGPGRLPERGRHSAEGRAGGRPPCGAGAGGSCCGKVRALMVDEPESLAASPLLGRGNSTAREFEASRTGTRLDGERMASTQRLTLLQSLAVWPTRTGQCRVSPSLRSRASGTPDHASRRARQGKPRTDVTRILSAIDAYAAEQLLPLVHDELRPLVAQRQRRHAQPTPRQVAWAALGLRGVGTCRPRSACLGDARECAGQGGRYRPP
jgi:hypothetical protein